MVRSEGGGGGRRIRNRLSYMLQPITVIFRNTFCCAAVCKRREGQSVYGVCMEFVRWVCGVRGRGRYRDSPPETCSASGEMLPPSLHPQVVWKEERR